MLLTWLDLTRAPHARQLDWRPILPLITVPCLNLYGSDSGCFPVQGTAAVGELIPTCDNVEFEGCNQSSSGSNLCPGPWQPRLCATVSRLRLSCVHSWLYLEEPARFATAVVEFVAAHSVKFNPATGGLPQVDDRCFVPASLWPDEKPGKTPHGKGWLATVVKVAPAAPSGKKRKSGGGDEVLPSLPFSSLLFPSLPLPLHCMPRFHFPSRIISPPLPLHSPPRFTSHWLPLLDALPSSYPS